MLIRVPVLRGLLALVSVLLAGATHAGAQLAAKSPFLPMQGAGGAAPTAGAPLEYRGTMQTAQGIKARIVDPAHRAGAWLLVNERDPSFDFVVKQIDTERDTVTVEYQGQTITLAQHLAKVASAGAPQNFAVGAPNPAANMPPAITQSVVVNPTPADEQRRLEAVAAEVARRRQLREQAAQQVNQGVSLAPQVIQQQQAPNPAQQNTGGQRPLRGQRPGPKQP
jgi:hypothetical protein